MRTLHWSCNTDLRRYSRGHKLAIDPNTRNSVRELIQRSLPQRTASGNRDNAHVESFLLAEGDDGPSIDLARFTSPPIFSKERQLGRASVQDHSATSRGLQGWQDLPAVIIPAKPIDDEEEDDIFKQHLVVVNGWGEYMRLHLKHISVLSDSPL